MLITLIIFVIVLSVLVFVHELGHFFTARKFGVRVEEFGFGLPPRIIGLRKKDGKFQWVKGQQENGPKDPTVYSLNWIPVGGFVKIKGENGEETASEDSFAHKKIWKRCIILAAGVFMNIVLCIVLLAIGFGLGMPAAVDNTVTGAIISQKKIQVMDVLDGSSAQSAGVKAGDAIIAVDGGPVSSIDQLHSYLIGKKNQKVSIELQRGSEKIAKDVEIKQYQDTWGMGVGLVEMATVRYPWYRALWEGLVTTYTWFITIVVGLYSLIKNLIVGAPVGVAVAGPVGIAALTGQAARMGFTYLLQFTALLSLNLAIINILPFPALDGGRIVFLIVEKIRGKSMKQQIENLIHNIGFLLLMVLILFVTYKDLARYGGRIINAFKSLIGL